MPNKRALGSPTHQPRTFDELLADYRVTPQERDALAWHLAMFRARKTYEALRMKPTAPGGERHE